MEYQNKNNSSLRCAEVASKSSRVGSFREVLEEVRDRIEIECYDPCDRAQAEEICMMIAEVCKLPPEAEVQIGGQKLPAGMVCEIYECLTNEHIRNVIKNYEAAEYEIKFKKTYLRTALYNEVFEFQSRVVNEISQFLPQYRPKRTY